MIPGNPLFFPNYYATSSQKKPPSVQRYIADLRRLLATIDESVCYLRDGFQGLHDREALEAVSTERKKLDDLLAKLAE